LPEVVRGAIVAQNRRDPAKIGSDPLLRDYRFLTNRA
jgi:hypothetical protein